MSRWRLESFSTSLQTIWECSIRHLVTVAVSINSSISRASRKQPTAPSRGLIFGSLQAHIARSNTSWIVFVDFCPWKNSPAKWCKIPECTELLVHCCCKEARILIQNRIGEFSSVAFVAFIISITRSITDCRAWCGKATSSSRHDPLTILCNRAIFLMDRFWTAQSAILDRNCSVASGSGIPSGELDRKLVHISEYCWKLVRWL